MVAHELSIWLARIAAHFQGKRLGGTVPYYALRQSILIFLGLVVNPVMVIAVGSCVISWVMLPHSSLDFLELLTLTLLS
ncbi:hypothetical protein V6N11_031445 [Hibiscus sabdariffa]|uniref:Uncharacterized protein n=1 Tax=Hibiscus sabdariffa TaxID=183260 RepID=A0ABR2SYI1_9ROSI